jgi:glycerol-3-phosphate dehydrogenase (NAD(P)+)
MQMSKVTMVGAGMMASALSVPLRYNGHHVRIVGTPLDDAIIDQLKQDSFHPTLKRRLPDGIDYFSFTQLDAAMADADLLIGGVSSFGVDWFINTIIPRIPDDLPVLSVTKGMLDQPDGTMLSYPELYRSSTTRPIRFNAIGGPCTSYELADMDPTEVTFCGWDMDQLRKIKTLFETPFYHISLSTDVRGVECAVALKNAYALAVSLAIGLSYSREGRVFEHYNSQAALFGQSVREMQGLLKLCGEKASNLYLGVGDLYVTVFGGRTRKIGTLLGQGIPYAQAMAQLAGITLESVVITERMARAVRQLEARGVACTADYPLLMHIDALITKGEHVHIPWDTFECEVEI